jgi:AcrR family transcriptional regulator
VPAQRSRRGEDRAEDDPLRRGYVSGRATREVIMQTAERLFAERGLEGVSLREVSVAAGQRNNYAIQYHFGDRDGLIKAIYEYRARELNERRLASIAELQQQGRAGDARTLLRALLEPHARHIGDTHSSFLGFLAQLHLARGHLVYFEAEQPQYMEGFNLIVGRIRRTLPQLPDDVFRRRLLLAFGWAISAMANYERAVNGPGPFALTVTQLLDEIVVMLVGALGASNATAERSGLRSVSPAK